VELINQLIQKYGTNEYELYDLRVTKSDINNNETKELKFWKKDGKEKAFRVKTYSRENELEFEAHFIHTKDDKETKLRKEIVENIIKEMTEFILNKRLDRLSFITGDKKIRTNITEGTKYDDFPIEYLDLSSRSYNCLKRDGYRLIGEVRQLSELELANIHQMGARSVKEVLEKLKEFV
jgi:DNA-directed RNA polymerase alpha subunit